MSGQVRTRHPVGEMKKRGDNGREEGKKMLKNTIWGNGPLSPLKGDAT